MPYHSLALLAILALGFLWLLGVQITNFVTFVQSYIGHALLIGLFLLLVQKSTMDDGKLTWTVYFNRLGSQSTSQVCVHRSNPSSHWCNWRCHQNFDNNNCPILCGSLQTSVLHESSLSWSVSSTKSYSFYLGFSPFPNNSSSYSSSVPTIHSGTTSTIHLSFQYSNFHRYSSLLWPHPSFVEQSSPSWPLFQFAQYL